MFIALVKGEWVGCSKTIDCNKTWIRLKAKNWNDARDEVKECMNHHAKITKDDGNTVRSVGEVTILDVLSEEDFDVSAWD